MQNLIWVQDDTPPTTCNGVDYYTHTAIADGGAYCSIDVSTYPDTGEVSGHTLTFSTVDGAEELLGKRLGLNEAKSLAQRDYQRRGASVREGAALS